MTDTTTVQADTRPYRLAAAGLHIFPTSGNKRPLTRHGLTEATTDHEQIAEWVIEYGDRIQGWGVNCGASGLVVADIDVKNGKDGLQALKAAQLELPRTFTYQTPSGGQHHIYRHELAHTFKSRADIPHNGQPLQGVDVRAGGGYIIWHGHETPYPETLAILPTPPAWLTIPRDTDNHTRPGEKATHAALTEWLNSDHTRNPATVHTIEATLTRLETQDFGHDELLRAQGAIARASGHGYQISGYEQRLRAAWLRAPWDTPERHREYTDGLAGAIAKYATDDTNEIDAARIIANIPTRHTETTQANNENTSTEDTTPTPTADDHTEQAIQTRLAQLLIDKEARQRQQQLEAATIALPEPIALPDFLAQPDIETEWVVENLLPAGGNILFASSHKAGKSTATANLIRAIVDETPFLNAFKTTQRRIILIDDELSEHTLRRWFREQNITNTNHVTIVSLRGKTSTFNITDPAIRANWANQLRDHDMVILDCLRPVLDAVGLSEDKDAGRFLVAFDELKHEAGIKESAVIHHMGHNGERSRGDSRLLDWPDAIWKIVRENPEDPTSPRYFSAYGRDVDHPETRLEYNNETRTLQLGQGSRKDAEKTRAVDDVIQYVKDSPAPLTAAAIERHFDSSSHARKTIREALQQAIATGQIIAQRGGHNSTLHSFNPYANYRPE